MVLPRGVGGEKPPTRTPPKQDTEKEKEKEKETPPEAERNWSANLK